MIYPLEQVMNQMSKTDHQLLYHMLKEQQETNRLLRQLFENKPETVEIDYDSMKRQELMKEIAKRESNPKGWNRWEREKMVNYLKGVE